MTRWGRAAACLCMTFLLAAVTVASVPPTQATAAAWRLETHRVIALAEPGQTIHQPFADAAMRWLSGTAVREGFAVSFQFGQRPSSSTAPRSRGSS